MKRTNGYGRQFKEIDSPYGDVRKGITEFVPKLDVLDDYQLTVWAQANRVPLGWDVKNKTPYDYMHDGLVEETREPWDPDRFNPHYDRMGSLLREVGAANQGDFFPGDMSGTAMELHQKEFGDISWYLMNRLALDGIVASAAVERGIRAYHTRAEEFAPGFHAFFEDAMPGFMYMAYSSDLVFASEAAMKKPSDETIEKLAEKAGLLIMMMAELVQARLGASYEQILQQNIAKIQKRTAEGTLFDKTGGDAR